jgi:hypothetical protein
VDIGWGEPTIFYVISIIDLSNSRELAKNDDVFACAFICFFRALKLEQYKLRKQKKLPIVSFFDI